MRLGPITIFKQYTIRDGSGAPYLVRYTLLDTPWFSLKLHKILRSDGDRELHDHPWSFFSFILRGGYIERRPAHQPPRFEKGEMLTQGRFHGAGTLLHHKAADLHRLDLIPISPSREVTPTWTLVLCSPKVREWGFATPAGWVQWEQYLERLPAESSATN